MPKKIKTQNTASTPEEYCLTNPDFVEIIQKFADGYTNVYNNRKVAKRKLVKNYLTQNLNLWWHSPPHEELSISPARFFNSALLRNTKFKNTVIYPVSTPVYSREKLKEIHFEYRAFTLENHPFLKDIAIFFDYVKNNSSAKSNNIADYIILNAPSLYKLVTFSEMGYLMALAYTCDQLSLCKFSEDSKTFVTADEHNFFGLPDKDKLMLVIDIMCDRLISALSVFSVLDKTPSKQDILDALKKSQEIGELINHLFGDSQQIFEGLMAELPMIMQDLDASEDDIDDSLMTKMAEMQMFTPTVSLFFFKSFGQFLQLIIPEHTIPYEGSLLDDEFLDTIGDDGADEAEKGQIAAINYTAIPAGYNLTPIAAELFGLNFSRTEQEFPWIKSADYKEILEEMLDDYDLVNPFAGMDPEDIFSMLNEFMQKGD